MIITLERATQKANLDLDLSALDWKHQSAGAEFTTLRNTGLPSPFVHLFIKRVAEHPASGHALLQSALERPLRCTPIFLGYKQDGRWHYYVFTLLSGATVLQRVFASTQYPQARFITRDFVSVMLRNACTVFEDINGRGYFYPDFCYKNLMGNIQDQTVLIIDMDSCYPLAAGRLPAGTQVDQTWWRLYFRSEARSASSLNPTMVLAMTVVLCHALASFECQPGVTNLADTVLRGRPRDQDELFDILDKRDLAAFCARYYGSTRHREEILEIFDLWQQFMTAAKLGRAPSWQQVRSLVEIMLSLTDSRRSR